STWPFGRATEYVSVAFASVAVVSAPVDVVATAGAATGSVAASLGPLRQSAGSELLSRIAVSDADDSGRIGATALSRSNGCLTTQAGQRPGGSFERISPPHCGHGSRWAICLLSQLEANERPTRSSVVRRQSLGQRAKRSMHHSGSQCSGPRRRGEG